MLLPAPTPRWPGGLLAFEESLGLLMSDKFFSAHLCTDSWAESNRSSTEEERRHFYDCLMAPMARQWMPWWNGSKNSTSAPLRRAMARPSKPVGAAC